MYLELAENCTTCLSENMDDMIPVVDDQTGEIYLINVTAFAELDPMDQRNIIAQAPTLLYILEKDNWNGMEGQLWDNIKGKVQGFVGKVKNFIGNVTGNMPQTAPTPGEWFGGPGTGIGSDPRFSVNIEPDPKPWFARPEVLLPILGGAVLLGFAIFKK